MNFKKIVVNGILYAEEDDNSRIMQERLNKVNHVRFKDRKFG
jgi:hypothetical protein